MDPVMKEIAEMSLQHDTDQCSEHCYLKREVIALEAKVARTAPLWSLLVLIGILIATAVFSFTESSKVRSELHGRITVANDQISDKLNKISTTLTEVRTKQEIILKKVGN
jgi:hypothetical protein